MSGTSEAVTQAARLDQIGFPEFTTKLITDVFDALVSSNLRQTEAYIQLLQETGKSLSAFINDTKDDISGDMILDFLATTLPAPAEDEDKVTVVENNNGKVSLDADQAGKLNTALVLPDSAGVASNNAVAVEGANNSYEAILDAVAIRIASNKYDLLKEMVKQGILRLVIENGEIETRLTFSTYGSSFSKETQTKYNRKNFTAKARAKTGLFTSLWVKAAASTKYSSVSVSTTNKVDQDRSGSRVNIYGGVRINFKTDYLPLNQ
ncbi:MAG: hypothetical protein U9R28_04305 [Pseudomonadota bacterium]|nr:hypothetical protein [Pseudomonadota bacterium]